MMLRVLSPRGVQFEGDAKSLNAKSLSGEITILDHHHPLMTVLARGMIKIEDIVGGKKEVEIESGFLEMDGQNTLTVLVQ